MNKKIYYVYRHTRLDRNEVFYIGIGTANLKGKSERVFYSRAHTKSTKQRNNWWHKIIAKTEYAVEIIFQTSTHKIAKMKEREFIKLYGRRDLGLGTLVNFTDGGEGVSNKKISLETRRKLSQNSKNRTGEMAARSKPIFVYTTDGIFYKRFPSIRSASQSLNIQRTNIDRVVKGLFQQVKGWIFKMHFEGDKIDFLLRIRRNSRTVVVKDLTTGESQEFPSVAHAAKFFNIKSGYMYTICTKRFKWKGNEFCFKS